MNEMQKHEEPWIARRAYYAFWISGAMACIVALIGFSIGIHADHPLVTIFAITEAVCGVIMSICGFTILCQPTRAKINGKDP